MRFNLYAGAGAGKSTVAAGLYYFLKCKNYNIELVFEYIKKWAYEGKQPKSFDQSYIFGKQLNSEDMLLQNGVLNLITDSPLMLQVFYAKKYGFSCWKELYQTALEFDRKHPAIDILLDRTGLTYQQLGRYQNKSQACEVDRELKDFLTLYRPNFKTFPSKDLEAIMDYIEPFLEKQEKKSWYDKLGYLISKKCFRR